MRKDKKQEMPFILMAENALVLEEIADHMDKISDAFKRIAESKLNRRTITILLQDMIGILIYPRNRSEQSWMQVPI